MRFALSEITRREVQDLLSKFQPEGTRPLSEMTAAAEAGDIAAIMDLARHYARWDVRDYRQEAAWYEKAVQAEHAPAYYNLGRCYAKGRGVEASLARALDLFVAGSEAGDADCDFMLYLVHKPAGNTLDKLKAIFGKSFCWDCDFEEEWPLAYRYLNQAVKRGHADALYFKAVNFERGAGVDKNRAKALALYREAAGKGCARAQKKLKTMPNLRLVPSNRFSAG